MDGSRSIDTWVNILSDLAAFLKKSSALVTVSFPSAPIKYICAFSAIMTAPISVHVYRQVRLPPTVAILRMGLVEILRQTVCKTAKFPVKRGDSNRSLMIVMA